ncbi:MAG: 5-(carboxyamino)imidazole ribonucleotide mutase [Firmicutes bacterium]|jgi:phosphoribosylaminoimidazole carboxylase, catalytic subunit|nr:5-(carboxyamino)imidazole ribonucleotide mutase [Bacillota bacterium]
MKKIGIVMGSDSDLPVVQKAIDALERYGVPFEVHVYSAHRTPEEARAFSLNARKNGFGAIIAAAGKAAHLAGALAANTTLPVIGIPVKSSTLDGLDALLSTVQMPSGIPVATVAIDGAENAALLALQILSVGDAEIAEKLDAARKASAETVLEKNAALTARFSK